MVLKDDWPYSRLINGASGKYAGASVKMDGMTRVLKVRLAGIVRTDKTTPGNMLPSGEPIPGNNEAAPKFPFPPIGCPIRLTNLGAKRLPSTPSVGPSPPIKGNCTNGWPPKKNAP